MSGTLRRVVAVVLVSTAFAGAVFVYRWRRGRGAEATTLAPTRLPTLSNLVCLVRGACDSAYSDLPLGFKSTYTGVRECADVVEPDLFGGWPLDDAGAHSFEWNASILAGGVFPSLDSLAVPIGCAKPRESYPFAMATIAFDLTGVDWAKPANDDVFILFQGESTVDHEFHATATFDEHEDGAPSRATIVADGPSGRETRHAGAGDAFGWGPYRASVVRIIKPQYDELEPIGWVEIKLSEPKPDAGRPARP
jgi:hypothetical protein